MQILKRKVSYIHMRSSETDLIFIEILALILYCKIQGQTSNKQGQQFRHRDGAMEYIQF